MTLRETLENSHAALTKAAVEHALIGGFALATLGIPRTTNDIDFLILEEDREKAKVALTSVGFTLAMETKEVLHFRGAGSVDLLLAQRPLSQQMLANSLSKEAHGIKCVTAEALIGLKIQAYKNDPGREFQDKADILSLIKKNPNLRWTEIKTYADLFDEWAFIEKLKSQI